LNEISGQFQSPNYPSYYPNESHCTWNITVPTNSFVQLTITKIDIESKWKI